MSNPKITPASVEADHVLLTGPISGVVTLDDGSVVDVTQPVIVVNDQEHANEIAHKIGLHWAEPGNIHPGQVDVDPETGEPVIREFVYDDSGYKAIKKSLKSDQKGNN